MEVVFVIAGIAVVLLLAELLLPTGGLLAFIGGVGLAAAGVVALNSDSSDSSAIGAALITAGVISVVSFAVIGRKVLRAQRDQPVNTGAEALIGKQVDVRESLNPVGMVYAEGALWRARTAEDGAAIPSGTRVRVESADGLTLVVSPPAEPSKQEES
jgi:membrane-bound ClpP family serine protease